MNHERKSSPLAVLRDTDADPLVIACALGLFYGCSPLDFRDQEPAALARLAEYTVRLIEEEISAHD